MRPIEHAGRRYRVFENGHGGAVICGGIGAEAARRATEALVQEFRPSEIWSAGFVGALDPALRVGQVIAPSTVIDARDGARTQIGSGQGTLVSFGAVAGREQKEKLRLAYGAATVDMEAAAVAQAAVLRGVKFGALKVVSDESDFAMPALEKFVRADGGFQTARFALYLTARPWLWGMALRLARNSALASRELCAELENVFEKE